MTWQIDDELVVIFASFAIDEILQSRAALTFFPTEKKDSVSKKENPSEREPPHYFSSQQRKTLSSIHSCTKLKLHRQEPKKLEMSTTVANGSIAALYGLFVVTFGVAIAALILPFTTPSHPQCESFTTDPPDIVGEFFGPNPQVLYSNATELGSAGLKGFRQDFFATEPADALFVAAKLSIPCDEDRDIPPFCVDGFLDDQTDEEACSWFWGGCQWTLYCVDTIDTAIQAIQPTQVSKERQVIKYRRMYLETGPAYLLPGNVTNKAQRSVISNFEFERM